MGYTDNCGGTVTATRTATVVTGDDCNWNVEHTYTVKDACLNELPGQKYDEDGGDSEDPALLNVNVDCSSLDITDVNECLSAAEAWDATQLEDDVKALYGDNCDNDLTVTLMTDETRTLPVENTDCSWSFTYEYLIEDDCGNSVTCTVTRSGGDQTPPTAVCKESISVYLDEDGTASIEPEDVDDGSYDNCGGTVSLISVEQNDFDCGDKGSRIVTLTVQDACGWTNTCLSTVEVLDAIDPEVVCPTNLTRNTDDGSCDYTVISTEFDATFDDNCPGSTISNDYNNGSSLAGAVLPSGPTTIIWTVTDMSNNTTACTIVVVVSDDELPTIVCPAATTVSCASNLPAPAPSTVNAGDNCGSVTKSHLFTTLPYDITCVNRFKVTRYYQVTDASNNTISCSQVITVFDNIQPVFTFVPANVTVQCNSVPSVGTPVATDGCGGVVNITYNGQSVSNVLCTDKYTLTREWTATDACGNTRTATQRITVIDSQAPAFVTAPANVTVQCDAIPALTSPTATDNCDSDVAITYVGQTRTNGTCSFRFTLTRRWVATDNCGNTRSITQRITVVDTGKPTLVIPANGAIACTDPIPPVGVATASDGCDTLVTAVYLGQTTVSGACPGNYEIRRTWRATDACGNSTVSTQTIQVTDGGAPVFVTVPGPITIECTDPIPPLVNPTATDACSGYVHITFLGNVATGSGCSADYTITRTWRAEDLCGNTATTTQLITVLVPSFAPPAQNRDEEQLTTHNSTLKTVSLTPNPTTDRVHIGLGDFAGETVLVSIYSDLGQLIWERKVEAVADMKLPVNLREAGAAAGLYTVSVRGGGQVVSKRLVLVE
ncbi:MAG: T9SS type A sorting domain-containing protein [Saprospiraceae bacterium]|nr:T9SS type A sorting domain-containing protein [Saprospiraceae bacterium]